jgi:hypothetical protein
MRQAPTLAQPHVQTPRMKDLRTKKDHCLFGADYDECEYHATLGLSESLGSALLCARAIQSG